MKEVVIKISDAMYKYITMEHAICIKEVGEYLFGLVRCTGTLLPKGHGDLVDRDKVIDLLNEQEYNYYTELDKVVDTVYEADAIIETDKEGEQE